MKNNLRKDHQPGVRWFLALFALVLVLMLLNGCSDEKQETPVAVKPAGVTPVVEQQQSPSLIIMQEALPLERVEQSAEALAVWRQYAAQKPTLLLLSNDPLLLPVPESLRGQVASLVASSEQAEIARQANLRRSDPLLSAEMTLDAALRSQLFGRVVWAVPMEDDNQVVEVATLRQQLQKSNLVNEEEAAGLVQQGNSVAGVLRNTPFEICSLQQLKGLKGPVMIHIDQSYFQKLYESEIKTPLLPILYNTLRRLQSAQLPTLAVTFAYGNLERRVALQARFIGELLDQLIANPQGLDLPVPPNWQRQVNIFYLGSLIQKDKIAETALAMAEAEPDKAWVQYTLYQTAQQEMAGDVALDYLAEAVKLDFVYALEYESLAEMAYDKGRPDAALKMLELAGQAFPDDPFINLKRAQLANDLGDAATARRMVTELQQLSWSSIYYQAMPAYLNDFAEEISAD